jgi:hypothetical protein
MAAVRVENWTPDQVRGDGLAKMLPALPYTAPSLASTSRGIA